MSVLGSVMIATMNTKALSFGLLPFTIALLKKQIELWLGFVDVPPPPPPPLPLPPPKIITEQHFEFLSTSCRFKNSKTLVGKKGGKGAIFLQRPVVKCLSVCVVDIVINHSAYINHLNRPVIIYAGRFNHQNCVFADTVYLCTSDDAYNKRHYFPLQN